MKVVVLPRLSTLGEDRVRAQKELQGDTLVFQQSVQVPHSWFMGSMVQRGPPSHNPHKEVDQRPPEHFPWPFASLCLGKPNTPRSSP